MTFVIGDVKHANLVDFLLSLPGHREPGGDNKYTAEIESLFSVSLGFPSRQPHREIIRDTFER